MINVTRKIAKHNKTLVKNHKKNREYDMSVHVLLNLLNELMKRDKMRVLSSILSLFATSFINSTLQ